MISIFDCIRIDYRLFHTPSKFENRYKVIIVYIDVYVLQKNIQEKI